MLEGASLGFVLFAADYIIIIGVFTVAAWLALMRGVGVVNTATLALPLTFVTYEVGMSSAGLTPLFTSGLEVPATGAAIFATTFFLIYMAVLRIMANTSGGGHGIISSIMSALIFTTMALAMWHQFYPFTAVWQFGPEIARFFDVPYFFWWIVGSLALLFTTMGFSFNFRSRNRAHQSIKKNEDAYAASVVYNANK